MDTHIPGSTEGPAQEHTDTSPNKHYETPIVIRLARTLVQGHGTDVQVASRMD